MISLPNSHNILQNTLYDYLLINAKRYDLSKILVSKVSYDDFQCLDPSDYILTYSHSTEKNPIQTGEIWRPRREIIEYDGNVALQFTQPENNEAIEWPLFLVLVNRVEFYPRPSFVPSKRRQKLEHSDHSVSETDFGKCIYFQMLITPLCENISYIHTHMHTHTHTHTHTCIHTHTIHTCTHAHSTYTTHMHTHKQHTCTCMHTHAHAYTGKHAHARIFTISKKSQVVKLAAPHHRYHN